ncbi:hypothetical protein HKD42_08915 [Altererythrobacter sp. RZ02]|uniref:Uncharacterized protein n=1 Tax=Pontixanthobacter rizhaonensis TaxID=2730337 RepID=A0A848QN58_9SPHN|nr:hypothetical protein [Pontixanthobacter rizhaonensis]NMW32180.1 hypothetical protein [Pontixanthobacter rizhaonensis]
MHKEGNEIHVTEQEASAGKKDGVMRWVLGISLTGAVIAMSIVWIIPALTS